MDTDNSRKYEEWLTVIANTRLVYNTMDELEDVLDNHSIHNNGIKRCFGTPQRMRAAFRDLKEEASLMTEGMVNLEKLLVHYKKAWIFFRDNLARRISPKEVALELLQYCYPPYLKAGISKKKAAIFEEVVRQNINVPLLVLMLLKIIPSYASKEGDVQDMADRYEQAMCLLEEFTKDGIFFNILPTITLARSEKCKSRLVLLYNVSKILDTYEAYVDSKGVYLTSSNTKLSSVDINLEGYWNECDGQLLFTDFWQFEEALNEGCYFLTHWHKDSENRLTGIRYTLFLSESVDGRLVAYILHPEAIKHRMKGLAYTDADNVWYVTDMPAEDAPDRLFFNRLIASNVWNLKLNLTRVTDAAVLEQYEAWLNKCELSKPFEYLEYEFFPNIYAITREYLYIPSGEEGEYFKVPRNAHEGFDQITLSDNVGTMKMNGRIYIAFDELLLYIGTTKNELKQYGIVRARCIE